MYYIYVLQSEKDGNFYTGFSKDLKQRFEELEKGLVNSTKDRRPLTLIYYEACIDRNDATKREKYFKTHYSRLFIKKRLKSYFTGQIWFSNSRSEFMLALWNAKPIPLGRNHFCNSKHLNNNKGR